MVVLHLFLLPQRLIKKVGPAVKSLP